MTCYFYVWRYHVYARKLTWYFTVVYTIKVNTWHVRSRVKERFLFQHSVVGRGKDSLHGVQSWRHSIFWEVSVSLYNVEMFLISAYKKLMRRKMRQLLGYQSHFCQSKPSHDFCVWLVICLPRIFLTDLWNVSPVLTLLNQQQQQQLY